MRWNYSVVPVEMTEGSTSRLVVQDHAQEATMDRRQPAVVIDKAKLLELIHEMIDPRPGCADHLCLVFLIDSGKHSCVCVATRNSIRYGKRSTLGQVSVST